MISIVCTYFDRQFQLNKTLNSFLQYNPEDFNVIIVDDLSPEKIILPDLPFNITVLRTENKKWTNPEPAYNMGIYYSLLRKPEIIILQNAECYHVGDVLSYANKVTPETYISFPCFSLDQKTTFEDHNIDEVIKSNDKIATMNGENAWYNHFLHRPVAYDFCSAITTENLIKLNGYDERFSDGCAYGDDYLLARIRMMGLNIEIPEKPFVVHQWHYTTPAQSNHAELVTKNFNLFNELVPQQNYRAEHKYTIDLK